MIVAVHSGTGLGDGTIYESQGKDLLKTLRGVDFLVCSHDHSALAIQQDSICLINSGSHARNIGHGRINLTLKDGEVVSKTVGAARIFGAQAIPYPTGDPNLPPEKEMNRRREIVMGALNLLTEGGGSVSGESNAVFTD